MSMTVWGYGDQVVTHEVLMNELEYQSASTFSF